MKTKYLYLVISGIDLDVSYLTVHGVYKTLKLANTKVRELWQEEWSSEFDDEYPGRKAAAKLLSFWTEVKRVQLFDKES